MVLTKESMKEVFYNTSDEDKFKIVKGYLMENTSMEKVGLAIYPHEEPRSAGYKVSAVMQSYGFSGGENHKTNSGKFVSWGINKDVTDDDIRAFVATYTRAFDTTDQGEKMRNFLCNRINARKEQERKKLMQAREDAERRRKNEAEEARKRQEEERRSREAYEETMRQNRELEERRRRRQLEAEEQERRRQAEIQRQKEEEERKEKEFLQEQNALKNKYHSMVNEADRMGSNTNDIDSLRMAVEEHRAAFAIQWQEGNSVSFNGGFAPTIIHDKTTQYMDTCMRLADYAFKHNDYKNAIKYGWYACADYPEDDGRQANRYDMSYFGMLSYDIHQKAGTPDGEKRLVLLVKSFTIIASSYFALNMDNAALNTAQYGVAFGSVGCMELLGDYYSKFDQIEYTELASYYYDCYGDINHAKLMKKQRTARKRVIAMRATEVEEVLNKYSPNWLGLPMQNGETWYVVSNLSACESNSLPRKPKNTHNISNSQIDYFKDHAYTPGKIDLRALWEVYKSAHQTKVRKALIFTNSVYAGELLEGDFADCCEYLWNKKMSETITNLSKSKQEESKHEEKGMDLDLSSLESDESKHEEKGVGLDLASLILEESKIEEECLDIDFSDLLLDEPEEPDLESYGNPDEILKEFWLKHDLFIQSFDDSKVGKIVQTAFREALESGRALESEIEEFQDAEMSKAYFNLNFPVLVEAGTEYAKERYYATPVTIGEKQYYISSQWFEKNKAALVEWLFNHQ